MIVRQLLADAEAEIEIEIAASSLSGLGTRAIHVEWETGGSRAPAQCGFSWVVAPTEGKEGGRHSGGKSRKGRSAGASVLTWALYGSVTAREDPSPRHTLNSIVWFRADGACNSANCLIQHWTFSAYWVQVVAKVQYERGLFFFLLAALARFQTHTESCGSRRPLAAAVDAGGIKRAGLPFHLARVWSSCRSLFHPARANALGSVCND